MPKDGKSPHGSRNILRLPRIAFGAPLLQQMLLCGAMGLILPLRSLGNLLDFGYFGEAQPHRFSHTGFALWVLIVVLNGVLSVLFHIDARRRPRAWHYFSFHVRLMLIALLIGVVAPLMPVSIGLRIFLAGFAFANLFSVLSIFLSRGLPWKRTHGIVTSLHLTSHPESAIAVSVVLAVLVVVGSILTFPGTMKDFAEFLSALIR